MTDVTIAGGIQPYRRKPNAPTEGKRRNTALTRKVKAAIDAQVFEGLTRAEAATKAGLSEHSLYDALRKPSVLQYWNECLQVMRTGARARNLHRLEEIRDQDDNYTAAVRAVQILEESADVQRTSAGQRVTQPGVTIYIGSDRPARDADKGLIEINPLSEHDNIAD
jgi:transposase-like protein